MTLPTTTLLDVLTIRFPQSSRTTLRGMIEDGRVAIAGKTVKNARQVVNDPAAVEVRPRAQARPRPFKFPFEVLHDDADLLVIHKPAGLMTSSGPRDKRPTVIGYLRNHFSTLHKPLDIGLIHRLDKDASGLLVFSKNDDAYKALKRQFADKSAGRTYLAIVSGTPAKKQGKIETYLLELPDGRVVMTKNKNNGLHSTTTYRTLETRGRFSMLEVHLETGRKHQIRVHLQHLGHPVAGDEVYHSNPKLSPRLMLCAVKLELEHPSSGQRVVFEAKPPVEVGDWWDALPTQPAHQAKTKPGTKPKIQTKPKTQTSPKTRPGK
jgi:23S rRNA pseudouridine1911/1915/1917 synthase